MHTIPAKLDLGDSSPLPYNASGHVTFEGYDTSKPYPGTLTAGWAIDVQVIADYPQPTSEGSGFLTTTQLLISRTYGNVSADPSWLACKAHLGRVDAAGDYSKPCSSMLGDECVAALKSSIAQTSIAHGKCWVSAALPTECEGRLIDDWGSFGPVAFDAQENTISFAGIVDDGLEASHQKGNFTAYDRTLQTAYVVAVWFMPESANETANQMSLVCVRPDSIAPGSRVPGHAPSTVVTPWVLFVVLLAASVLVVS
ncbi:hypothetical protein SCUP234_09245 [Seiridium cupressi]